MEITTSYLSEQEVWKNVCSHTQTHTQTEHTHAQTKMSRMQHLRGFMWCHAAVTVYGSEIRAKPQPTFDIFNPDVIWTINN